MKAIAAILLSLTLFSPSAHACIGQDSLKAHLAQVESDMRAMATRPERDFDFNDAANLVADQTATEEEIADGCADQIQTASNN